MAQARVANKLAVLHPDLHPIVLRASSWEGREAAIRFINHLDDATLAAVCSWEPAEDEVLYLSQRMQQLRFNGGVYEGRPITDLGRARRCMDLAVERNGAIGLKEAAAIERQELQGAEGAGDVKLLGESTLKRHVEALAALTFSPFVNWTAWSQACRRQAAPFVAPPQAAAELPPLPAPHPESDEDDDPDEAVLVYNGDALFQGNDHEALIDLAYFNP